MPAAFRAAALGFSLLVLLAGASPAADSAGVLPVDDGRVLAGPPEGRPPIVIHEFGTDGADLGTGAKKDKPKYREIADQMKASAPITLAQSLVRMIDDEEVLGGGLLALNEEVPEGALHLKGEFTVLNPGSRGKRYWVGMGAGRSRVCVHGELRDAADALLVEFDHCRSGTGTWSAFGGRSEGMMVNDLVGTAEKVAKFLEGWAEGRFRP